MSEQMLELLVECSLPCLNSLSLDYADYDGAAEPAEGLAWVSQLPALRLLYLERLGSEARCAAVRAMMEGSGVEVVCEEV